jgi:hypothetical protein
MIGADKVVRMPNPIMGAEDFSYACCSGCRAR